MAIRRSARQSRTRIGPSQAAPQPKGVVASPPPTYPHPAPPAERYGLLGAHCGTLIWSASCQPGRGYSPRCLWGSGVGGESASAVVDVCVATHMRGLVPHDRMCEMRSGAVVSRRAWPLRAAPSVLSGRSSRRCAGALSSPSR
jgi:hypothetical protein